MKGAEDGQARPGAVQAQADAYFAGCDEGHRLAREYLEKVGDGKTAPNAGGNGPSGVAAKVRVD